MEWLDTAGQNRAIELHDSQLVAVRAEGDVLTLELSPAWIHCSPGEPVRDPGSSWTGEAILRLEKAHLDGNRQVPGLPARIIDGKVSESDDVFENVLWVPFVLDGSLMFSMNRNDGSEIDLTARRMKIDLAAEATFMDAWPPRSEGFA